MISEEVIDAAGGANVLNARRGELREDARDRADSFGPSALLKLLREGVNNVQGGAGHSENGDERGYERLLPLINSKWLISFRNLNFLCAGVVDLH
jgi:hypothetical protein